MSSNHNAAGITASRGFTLTELAIVLVIVALLVGGMLISVSTSRDIANEKETQKQLMSINEALLGFAAGHGRLPCPATVTSTGRESFCTNAGAACGAELFVVQAHGQCTEFFDGFIPAASLGISPTDGQGFAIDAWGNRIRYAVSNNTAGAVNFPFTTPSGIKTAWGIDPSQIQPDLRVCNKAAGIAGGNCGAGNDLTTTAVAVVFSTGRNGGAPPPSADELANWTTSNDRVFVSMTQSPNFDDIVTWVSPNILYNRLISAGRLP